MPPIAALERMVGRRALELEFPKGGLEKRTAAEQRAYVHHHRHLRRRRMPADGSATLDLRRRTCGASR